MEPRVSLVTGAKKIVYIPFIFSSNTRISRLYSIRRLSIVYLLFLCLYSN